MQKPDHLYVEIIRSDAARLQAQRIRKEVFVEEQKVPPEIEYDEFENTSTHILVQLNDAAVGTARWRKTENGYKLERFAVLPRARGKGVGREMLVFILTQLNDDRIIYLHSQVSAMGFYSKLGFRAEGDIFYEANIPHRKMIYLAERE